MHQLNRLFSTLIYALVLTGGVPFVVASAVAQPIHSNLILNGDFEALTDWTLLDAPLWGYASYDFDFDCHPPNPTGCLEAEVTPIASGGEGRVSAAWQCIDVEENRVYFMSMDVWGGWLVNPNPLGSSVRLMMVDATGVECPVASEPPPLGDALDSLFVYEPTAWITGTDVGLVPPAVTRIAVALHTHNGSSSRDASFYFDNIELGKHLPDVGVDITTSSQALTPMQEFPIEVTYDSEFNGMQPDLRIFHEDLISLVDYECDAGNVVDASQGGEHFFHWFNIPEDPQPYELTCTITARANAGYAGPFDLHVVAECEDCASDLNPADNEQTISMEIAEAPDVAATISASDLPEAGATAEVTLALENLGTNTDPVTTDVSIILDVPLVFESADGSSCSLSETQPGTVEGSVTVDPSVMSECVLTFSIPNDQPTTTIEFTTLTVTNQDYNSTNDSDTTSARIVNLLVNRSIDGWDGSPGDGICESSSGNDDCSLRAAVMEANALAAATGRRFTVKVPYSPFSYTLTRTSGDEETLYGSLKINRRMHLVGIPDEEGNLPVVIGSFPSADADRLISIGNPAGFVRIENMLLQGQGLVPTDTDEQGRDGGLILHQSGELVLSNVTLVDGMTNGSGGALHSASDDANGHLTLEQVRMFGNQAADGGGLTFMPESFATLSIIDSNIHDNQANVGGGILVWNSGGSSLPAVAVQRSTLHGNNALLGGGAYLSGVFLAQVNNSTISGNTAETSGGGVSVEAETALAVNNSTIAHNEAGPGDDDSGIGGGFYVNANSTTTLYNSIVSNNTAKLVCSTPKPPFPPICLPRAANCHGTVESAGYNAMAGDSECAFNSEPSDDTTHVQLEPLADNGGPTPTHAPASFNWIVDAGDPACLERPGGDALTIDQRGALRPFNGDETLGAQCDRGAYELSDSARVDVVVDDAALGQVLSSPTGIWCGAGSDESCSALFGFKTEVTLTASANSGSGGEFVEWQGACAGQGNPCTVIAAGNVETTAVFVPAGPVEDALFSDRFEIP